MHAHSRGIIHRRATAERYFILRDGTAKLTDFGMPCSPRRRPAWCRSHRLAHYISPEAKGKRGLITAPTCTRSAHDALKC